jgi:hypothetical protein
MPGIGMPRRINVQSVCLLQGWKVQDCAIRQCVQRLHMIVNNNKEHVSLRLNVNIRDYRYHG